METYTGLRRLKIYQLKNISGTEIFFNSKKIKFQFFHFFLQNCPKNVPKTSQQFSKFPNIFPKCSKNDPKCSKMAQKWHFDIWGTFLGPKKDPKWEKMTQKDPLWPQMTWNGPKMGQKWLKMAQKWPKKSPVPHSGRNSKNFPPKTAFLPKKHCF